MQKLSRSLIAVCGLAMLAACGDDVSVTAPPTPDVVISGAPSQAIKVGDKVQLSANQGVTWASSAATIASVDANGLVTGVAAGSASITATSTADATKKASVSITVSASKGITGITVSPPAAILAPQQTLQAVANVTADPGVARTVTWSTSAASVATVSTTGVITAVAPGAATITAASTVDPTFTAALAITVRAPTPPSVNIGAITAGTTTTPVDQNNVQGQIDVAVNLDPGDFTIQKLELLLDGSVVGTQTFSAEQLEAMRLDAVYPDLTEADVSVIHFLVNTAAFDTTTGVARFFNGNHALSAKVTVSGGGSGGAAAPSLTLVFNNASGIVLGLTNDNGADAKSAINPGTGLVWIGGGVTIKAIGVSYVSGAAYATVTIANPFGKNTTTIALTNGVGSQAYTEGSSAWSTTNTSLTNYLSSSVEQFCATSGTPPVCNVAGATFTNGNAAPTTVLNGINAAVPALPLIRVDNTAPGATSANGVAQAALATTTTVIWVKASTSFAAGQLGIASSSTLNASTGGTDVEEGVDNVTVEVWATPNGGSLPSGCSTTGLAKVTTGADLAETTVSSAYIARVLYKDALGNIACTSLSSGTQFGADFTPPTFTSVSGPSANTGYTAPANFTVNGPTDNASGFSATPLVTKITYETPTSTAPVCFIGSGSSCTATATANPTASVTGTQGYYTATIDLADQAGNTVSVISSRLYLFDNTAPTFSGGISLPSVIAGAATNTFTAAVGDNLDVNAVYARVQYPGHIFEYPSQNIGTFGKPFETTATVNYAVSNWIRCLNNPGDFTTTTNKPTQLAMIVSDFANSTAGLLSPLFGANAENCGTVGNIAPADIFSFTQSLPNYGTGNTNVDRDGSSVATGSSTSVTLTAVADVALNSSADPFSRVDVYYVNAGGANVKAGTASVQLAQTPTQRTYTYTFVWDPDAAVQTGAVNVRFVGVDAQGDAVHTTIQVVNVVP
jgi:hypothetical protein